MRHYHEPLFKELARALRKRLEVIQDQRARELDPNRHLALLAKVSEEIDQLVHSLPPDTHPRLLHFLERASYSKALEFLEAKD
jgi:hypothetical protein